MTRPSLSAARHAVLREVVDARSSHHRPSPVEALLRPVLITAVVLRHSCGVRRQHHPRLFAGSKNVDVRRQQIRLIERAHTNEPERIARTAVVAPDSHATMRATNNALPFAACR